METLYINRPNQYAIYKGIKGNNGAIQFNLIPFDPARANVDDDRKLQEKDKKGWLLIDAASASGPNQYDWSTDIKFSMSETDIGKFLVGIGRMGSEGDTLVNIFHKHEKTGATKKLIITQGRVYQGNPTWMFALLCTDSTGTRNVNVPISKDEMLVLKLLLEAAVPSILGWSARSV